MIWTSERQQLAIESLHTWKGTKYGHRIAVPGVGIDCVHLVGEVLIAAGIVERRTFGGYSVDEGVVTTSTKLREAFMATLHLELVDPDAPEFGDIIDFDNGTGVTAHCAIYENGNVWHSLSGRGVTKSDYAVRRRRVAALMRITQEGYRMNPEAATLL